MCIRISDSKGREGRLRVDLGVSETTPIRAVNGRLQMRGNRLKVTNEKVEVQEYALDEQWTYEIHTVTTTVKTVYNSTVCMMEADPNWNREQFMQEMEAQWQPPEPGFRKIRSQDPGHGG
jgi:hypothetical protein